MISVRHLTKSYAGTTVVDDVSLEIPRGGVTALVGGNGAGKSTLLGMVARLVEPSSGTVLLDDLDVRQAPSAQIAQRLAVLRQDTHLTPRLTVRDLVGFGRFPHSRGRLTETDRASIDEALAFFELTPLADRFLDELSGGQRQRAFVAMTLAQETPYVLLDEPLNNLDMRHATAMMRRLRSAADRLDRTIVVVIHDINVASCYADRIVAMREGRVVADGEPGQIMRTSVLEEVFDLHIPVERVHGHLLGMHYTATAAPRTRTLP